MVISLEFIKGFLIWFNWLFNNCIVRGFMFFLWLILLIKFVNELYDFEKFDMDLFIVEMFLCIVFFYINDDCKVVRLLNVWWRVFVSCDKLKGMIWEFDKFNNMLFMSRVMVWWILNLGLVNFFI